MRRRLKTGEPVDGNDGLASWARWQPRRLLQERLRLADDRMLGDLLLVTYGAPIVRNDAVSKRLALAYVERALYRIRAPGRDAARELARLVYQLADDVDARFERFEPDADDVALVLRKNVGAKLVTAHLLCRAGACGVPQRDKPTSEQRRRVQRGLMVAAQRDQKR